MRRTILTGLAMTLFASAAPLAAQGAPPARADRSERGGHVSAAEQFLARTGELRLTDAQVTRLAAIARRSQDRRRALAERIDSLAPARVMVFRRDSAGRAGRASVDSAARAARTAEVEQVRTLMEQQREQARAELRDALAVLTPEQLVTAWEMRSGDHPDMMRRSDRADRAVERPAPRRELRPARPTRPTPARPGSEARRPPRDSR